MPLRVFLFGAPRCERDGEPIDIGRRKVLALLAHLAVSAQPHSREALALLLTPDADDAGARASLRRTLSRLKQAVGDDAIDATRTRIGMDPGASVWVDVAQFRAHIAAVAGHEHGDRPLCADCAAELRDAVALYTDDFLAGFHLPDSDPFEEWRFFEQEALRQQLAQALQQLIAWYAFQGDAEAAIPYARRWLALDPLHEAAHRKLMELYARGEQWAAAQRQYEEARRILDEELGVEPDAETEALYAAITSRQLPAHAAAPAPDGLPTDAQRYVAGELIASGGQGEVLRGLDRVTGREVIIKRLPASLIGSPERVARFRRESQLLYQLEHPNIVCILAAYEQDGEQRIVMDYVPGGTLRERLDEEAAMPVADVIALGLELADALARAHHIRIIHRDVKPENVLLAADGTPRLTDFGVARLVTDEARITRTGALLGSPAYMSPELLQGGDVDERSDIWSLGVMLYEMLAGQRPFAGETVSGLILDIIQGEPAPLEQVRPDVPPALAALIRRMLAKHPAQRLPTMRQAAAALEAIQLGDDALPLPLAPGAAVGSGVTTAEFMPGPPAPEPVFVGREAEMARLTMLFQGAVQGRTGVAFVVGDAGQGKTTLIRRFARRMQAEHPGLVVAVGNCNAYTGVGDPYLPFREILEFLTGNTEGHQVADVFRPDAAQELRRLLPNTAQALVETAPDLIHTFLVGGSLLARAQAVLPAGDPSLARIEELVSDGHAGAASAQQGALFAEYERFLRRFAQARPLLLLLDDLQWADSGSTNLLLHLGRRLRDVPVFILGAHRPAEVALGRGGERHPLEAVLNELQRDFGDMFIDLSRAQGRAFVDALLDSQPNRLDDDFRAMLAQQTGGHPLFTIELLRDMRERGDLDQDEDGRWAVQPGLSWERIPARVEGIIGERIGRLAPELQELLQVASVEGEEFTVEVVAGVTGASPLETMQQLSRRLEKSHQLVRALGVRRDDGVRTARYRFRHILIQRYLYQSLDEVERTFLHEMVGDALESIYGDTPSAPIAQLAHHFTQGESPARAAAYLIEAGDRARRAAALHEAIDYYQAALAQAPPTDPAAQADVLRRLGECQWTRGDLDDAMATFEAAADLFARGGDKVGVGAMQRRIGRVYWEQGNRELSLQYYHKALDTLEAAPESVELAWAISSISQMHMLASEYEDAVRWGERALALADKLGAEAVRAHALNNVGDSLLFLEERQRGRAMMDESWEIALRLGMPHDACRARGNLAEALMAFGEYEEARKAFVDTYELAARVHAPLFAGVCIAELADLDWQAGQWQAALDRREEGERWIRDSQNMGHLVLVYHTFFAEFEMDVGLPLLAYERLEPVLPLARSMAELQLTVPFLGALARALMALAHDDEVEQLAAETMTFVDAVPYTYYRATRPLLLFCRWYCRRGNIDQAGAFVHRLERALDQFGSPLVKGQLAEARGHVAMARGDASEAVAHFQDAVAHWRAIPRPFAEARALLELSRAQTEGGATDAAWASAAKARILVEGLAANLLDDALRQAFLASPFVGAIGEAASD